MNAARICNPNSVRIGTFCKFGSCEARRPSPRRFDRSWCAGVLFVGERGQRVHVRPAQLGQLAVFEDALRQVESPRQFFEDVGGSRLHLALPGLRGCGKFSFSNSTCASCCGDAILNSTPQLIDRLRQGVDLNSGLGGKVLQEVRVQEDAARLHVGEHSASGNSTSR